MTEVLNNPNTDLSLRPRRTGEDLQVVFSYEVEWQPILLSNGPIVGMST